MLHQITLDPFITSTRIKDDISRVGTTFANQISDLERKFIRERRNLPTLKEKKAAATAFWALNYGVEAIVANNEHLGIDNLKKLSKETLGGYFDRCLPINRSTYKPYGYPGDFSIIELLYNLEENAGDNPYISGVSNCLDYAFSTIPSVQSLWERRRWLADILRSKRGRHDVFRVLDVACGGARYIKDFLDSQVDVYKIEITLIDQEPAALNYVMDKQLEKYRNVVKVVNIPISQFKKEILPKENEFDLIISAGLFDYLNDNTAKGMIDHFSRLLSDQGAIAITNYSNTDYSAFTMEWFADWKLKLRNPDNVMSWFSCFGTPRVSLSSNCSLIFALLEKNMH